MEFQHYTEGQLWRVVQINGKGLGAIAKTDISKGPNLTVIGINENIINTNEITGTLILRDKPLFIIPNEVHTDDPDTLNTFLKGNFPGIFLSLQMQRLLSAIFYTFLLPKMN